MREDCQHLSWECSWPIVDYVGAWHNCTDCDFCWGANSVWGKNDQIGICTICGKSDKDSNSSPSVSGWGYLTKDSGNREEFSSGAVRDTQDDKPRYDLIPPKGLKRVAELYARGATKYADHNWRKGMPSSRFMASMMRHSEQYRAGDRDEDHLAGVIFNALALIEFEGTEWDDLSTLWTGEEND